MTCSPIFCDSAAVDAIHCVWSVYDAALPYRTEQIHLISAEFTAMAWLATDAFNFGSFKCVKTGVMAIIYVNEAYLVTYCAIFR
jgi:hypothetical protein